MIVWDTGTWAPMEDAEQGPGDGRVQVPAGRREAQRRLDAGAAEAEAGREEAQLAAVQGARPCCRRRDATSSRTRPESVKTGRRDRGAGRGAGRRGRSRPARLQARRAAGRGARRPVPARVEPQLATLGRARRRRATAGCTRSSSTATARWRTSPRAAVAADHPQRARLDASATATCGDAFAALPCREAVIDGEIVVLDDGRRQPLRRCCRTRCRERRRQRARLLRLRPAPPRRLGPRRGAARAAQGAAARSCSPGSRRALGDPVQRPRRGRRASALRAGVASSGSRGSSRSAASAPYQPGRSKTWIKAKALKSGDFVIAGYTVSAAAGGLAALALGEWVGRRARLSRQGRHRLRCRDADAACWRGSSRSRTGRSAARRRAEGCASGCGRCCRRMSTIPTCTGDGSLRHAVFKGLRERRS